MLVQPLLNCQVHSRMCKTVCCRIVLCTVARVQLSSGSVNGFLPHYETEELLRMGPSIHGHNYQHPEFWGQHVASPIKTRYLMKLWLYWWS